MDCHTTPTQPHVTLRLRFLSPEPMQLRKMVPLCWSVRMLNCTLRNSRMCRSVHTAYGVKGPSRTCVQQHQQQQGVSAKTLRHVRHRMQGVVLKARSRLVDPLPAFSQPPSHQAVILQACLLPAESQAVHYSALTKGCSCSTLSPCSCSTLSHQHTS
jgi:hypothetical protein